MNNFFGTITVCCAFLFLHSCAGTRGAHTDKDSRTYNKSYNEMVKIVERAVKGGEFGIPYSEESGNPPKMLIIYSKMGSVGTNSVQQQEGKITVQKIADNKTKVIIKNPEYDVMISSNTQRDYRRYFFSRIEDLVKS